MSWKETDPLAIWKSSTLVPVPEANHKRDLGEKSSVGQRFAGQRSRLWTSLSELPQESRQHYISKLIDTWPYKWEHRAMHLPPHIMTLATAASTAYASNRINADIFLCDAKASLIDSMRKCSKVPLMMGVYMFGITSFSLTHTQVYKGVAFAEEPPEPWSIYKKMIAIALGTGVALPVLALPHLAYHIKINNEPKHFRGKNFIDAFTLSYEYSRSMWRKLPSLILFQTSVAVGCTYSLLWARDRIFNTIDADPEMVRERVAAAESKEDGFFIRLRSKFRQGANRLFEAPFGEDIATGLKSIKEIRNMIISSVTRKGANEGE